jgi:arsenate reductase (thioredoxin)
MDPRRVLFVCMHNSARSQMAEGLLRAWGGDAFEAHSAGSEATAVRPEAVAVMGELGIDISAHTSKTVERYVGEAWDYLIPVCEEACQACPYVPGAKAVLRWAFDDPAMVPGSQDERLVAFRRVRDELATQIREFITAAA